MDERLQFVARRLAGEPMAELCREFGISRKTGYKIFDRYEECGIQGLTGRSRRPLSMSRASSRSNFCFFTRLALISAGSPIHSSKPTSASSRSNQREYPVASMPTRTQIPRCFRSRVAVGISVA